MRTLATKQPVQDSAKQLQERTRSTLAMNEMRSSSISPLSTGASILQRQCACGGNCPRCRVGALQTKLKMNEPGDKYEQEADGNADRVMRMPDSAIQREVIDPAEVPSTVDEPAQQLTDDPYCLHTRPGEGSERCEFTLKQQNTLSFVHYAAQSLTSLALMNLSRGDPYMTTLVQRIFHSQDNDMNQIRTTMAQILDNLRSKPIVCGTCADADCYIPGVLAHVTPDLSTTILCQRFFQTNVVQMRRTLIHEAGHAAGIDSSLGNVTERYCAENIEGCVDPCSNLTGDLSQNVDAWARLIECAAYSG